MTSVFQSINYKTVSQILSLQRANVRICETGRRVTYRSVDFLIDGGQGEIRQ